MTPRKKYKVVFGEASAPVIVEANECDPEGTSFNAAKRKALAFISQQLRFWSFRLDAMLTHQIPDGPEETV